VAGGSSISLYELHEFHFCSLLKKGALHQAIESIEAIIALEPSSVCNIIYPIMVFKHLACEFIYENKALMIDLLAVLFRKPHELLKIYKQLMGKSFNNEEQKAYLTEYAAQHPLPAEERVKLDNFLFNDDFLEYLRARPEKNERVA
jgi:hypothetical protein